MPSQPTPGRSLVTRRAVADVVRAATLGSYGVTGFAVGPVRRMAAAFGIGRPGLRIDLSPGIAVELHLTVASGLPIAEVARQVESAVRYAVRRAIGREIDRLAIHIGGLRYQPGTLPTAPSVAAAPPADDLVRIAPVESAASGRET